MKIKKSRSNVINISANIVPQFFVQHVPRIFGLPKKTNIHIKNIGLKAKFEK